MTVAGMTLACTAGLALADLSPGPYALGGGSEYHQTNTAVQYTVEGFGTVSIDFSFVMTGFKHAPPVEGAGPSFGASGGESTMHIGLNDLVAGDPYMGSMDCTFFDVFTEWTDEGTTRNYDTEMLSLDMMVFHPAGDFMIRESPTLASLGHYTIHSIGAGQFQIDSFFDIFTELSIDGGETWFSGDGAAHMELIPAPTAAALFALFGLMPPRRRR
ncbi:MAG: hypothetical protein K8R92_03465 [Planctomycetes bacterium]|nr:hypothetical protein [Planctomycetota bacterium]